MPRQWTSDDILQLASGFQQPCVLAAAADLDLFNVMGPGPFTAAQAADRLGCDLRGIAILLDALAAMQMMEKSGDQYSAAPGVAESLTSGGPGRSVLAMVQHQANCLRRWSMLARTVKTGQPPERTPSIRGADADYEAFIEAMDNVSRPMAEPLVNELDTGPFNHLLDVGGASGTWTIAFLKKNPAARATIFDLPQVRSQAEQRLAEAGLADRVAFVAGDFYVDPLPQGADLAWISAIVHQNSRQQNRDLFRHVHSALQPGGRILIRDILMDEDRTSPVRGALFAVNMLSATPRGGTFTVRELTEDLESAGFADVAVLRKTDAMDSVLAATRP